ncbi:hypothetical protein B0O99DRAFT_345466 [Bisporella sp. PMI_857]|nr:hypothetical protein B0O99DRAFT_345466 [Bisporella sp. PMI_857]
MHSKCWNVLLFCRLLYFNSTWGTRQLYAFCLSGTPDRPLPLYLTSLSPHKHGGTIFIFSAAYKAWAYTSRMSKQRLSRLAETCIQLSRALGSTASLLHLVVARPQKRICMSLALTVDGSTRVSPSSLFDVIYWRLALRGS